MAALADAIAVLRGAHDAALLSLVGALVFLLFLPERLHPPVRAPIRRLAFASGVAALGLGVLWFLVDDARVAQADGLLATLQAVPAFVVYLRFGRLLLLQLALIAAALALVRWRGPALVAAALALVLQPWLGHPAEVGRWLAAIDAAHLLAAATWAGELLPLLLCLFLLRAPDAAEVLRRFFAVGLLSVAVLLGSGAALGLTLAGGLAGLAGTRYGHIALLKAGLFALALLFAARNQFLLTPRLGRSRTADAALGRSVAVESLIALAIVLAAGWLSQLPPGAMAMH